MAAQVNLPSYSHSHHLHFHVLGVGVYTAADAGSGAAILQYCPVIVVSVVGTNLLPPEFDRRPTHNTISIIISSSMT